MTAEDLQAALGAGYPSAAQEKETLLNSDYNHHITTIASNSTKSRGHTVPTATPSPRETMPSSRHLLTLLLICFLVVFGVTSAYSPAGSREPCHEKAMLRRPNEPQPAAADETRFRQLVDSVTQDHLHDLLHRYFPDRYKHGVYETERSAMEAVHRADAALASSMVHIARRQAGNSTTTPPPDTTSTPNPPPPTDTTTSEPPPPPPTTITSVTTLPGETSGVLTTITSTPTRNTDDVPTPTSKNEPAKSSPKGSKPVTSTFTSLINGTPTVVTATSYVGVDSQDSATSTRPGGSLQTNAAVSPKHRGRLLETVVGVVFGGVMLV